jgi:hypothetical protein
MPRKADEFEVLEKPKRAPRKRVAKPVDDTEEVKPKRTRKAVKKDVEEVPERKAPTVLKEEKKKSKFLNTPVIVVGVLLILGIGSSAAVGLTDKGQIDVVTMINERNKKAEERGEKIVSSAMTDQLPDGGLIPADPATIASSTPPVETASSTATTTPQGNLPRTDEEIASDTATATST